MHRSPKPPHFRSGRSLVEAFSEAETRPGEGIFLTIDNQRKAFCRNIIGSHASNGHVFWGHNNSRLTLRNSSGTGSIEGGKANNGGAIFIEPGSTVTAENITFRNNSAADHAGAIWNGGTLTATNCSFNNNRANDVGGIGSASATFRNENSQLEEDTEFDVYHTSGAASWAVQNGTVENLPDYLSATAVKLSDQISLQPCMTYFHIVFDPLDQDYASAYLSKMEGTCMIYSAPGVKGGVTVTPAGGNMPR